MLNLFLPWKAIIVGKTLRKKYLDPTLTIAKMYELFQNLYKDQNNLPKEHVYRNIFVHITT